MKYHRYCVSHPLKPSKSRSLSSTRYSFYSSALLNPRPYTHLFVVRPHTHSHTCSSFVHTLTHTPVRRSSTHPLTHLPACRPSAFPSSTYLLALPWVRSPYHTFAHLPSPNLFWLKIVCVYRTTEWIALSVPRPLLKPNWTDVQSLFLVTCLLSLTSKFFFQLFVECRQYWNWAIIHRITFVTRFENAVYLGNSVSQRSNNFNYFIFLHWIKFELFNSSMWHKISRITICSRHFTIQQGPDIANISAKCICFV